MVLRVIHSAPVWLPATQTWMHTQARALPADIENHVVCEVTENLSAFPMANIHALADGPRLAHLWDKGMRGFGRRLYLGHLPKVARRIDADLVHSHFGHIGWGDLGALRRSQARHVVTFYGQDLTYLPKQDPRWRTRYTELFRRVDRVLCEGPHMGSVLRGLGCPVDKVTVQHLGVDLEAFKFTPRRRQQGEPFKVLMAGSFTEKKGIPDGLRALGEIGDEVDLRVTLIGDANDKPRNQAEKARILTAIEASGLTDRITLPGYQTHEALLQTALEHHVFLSPSVHAADGDTEGGAPVTIIELAATGMPVVSTRHCDIPAVIREEEGGLLADEGDVAGLADHLRALAAHPDTWEGMGRCAREHIAAQYDMGKQGEALAGIYRAVCGAD